MIENATKHVTLAENGRAKNSKSSIDLEKSSVKRLELYDRAHLLKIRIVQSETLIPNFTLIAVGHIVRFDILIKTMIKDVINWYKLCFESNSHTTLGWTPIEVKTLGYHTRYESSFWTA